MTVTVVGESGDEIDVDVRCRETAVLSEVLEQLVGAGLLAPSEDVLVDGRSVARGRLVGTCLTHGGVISTGQPPATVSPPLVELRVVSGPRCGAVHALRPGRTVIGRGPSADVRIDDLQVSRDHLALAVSASGITVQDLGSTNGSLLDGTPVPVEAVTYPLGAPIRVGTTTLVVELATPHPPRAAPEDGRRALLLPPRLREPQPEVTVRFPDAPGPARSTRFPVVTAVAPLVVGVVAAAVLGSPTFLVFALLSPLVAVAGGLADSSAARRDHRQALRAYADETARREEELQEALRAEEDRRRDDDPDCAHVALEARRLGPRLWERRPDDDDVLRLRLGTGDLPARVRVRGAAQVACRDVPVTLGLRTTAGLGLVGERADVLAVARAVITSAAVLHSPTLLQISVLCGESGTDWRWARWLPHTRGPQARLAFTAEEVERRLDDLVTRLPDPSSLLSTAQQVGARHLVVVDDPAVRDHPALVRLLAEGPASGVHVLALAPDLARLPSACSAVFEQELATGLWTLRADGRATLAGVVGDGVTQEWAANLARGLAPVVATNPAGSPELPEHVLWRDVLGLSLTDQDQAVETVVGRWAARTAHPVPLGVGARGQVEIDLRRHGPHVLVAGTTGSGKSELLQTLVAGLASALPPEALQLVLVDYKGGAAFGRCADLPHTAGVVTDLDPALTRRALASLSAELRRRERVLRDAAVADLEAYEALRAQPTHAALAPMARLVLVVDEFATLAEELPEFVRGLVAVAQRGRSLGVHLVLATQRPEGSVSQEIRANTALRICLAVARDAESRDVVDAPDAARIGRNTPGRALLRHGPEPLVAFQTARITVPSAESHQGPEPTVVCLAQDQGAGASVAAGDGTGVGSNNDSRPRTRLEAETPGVTDLDLLVDACRRAASRRGVPRPESPWLPPLPRRVLLAELSSVSAPVQATPRGDVPFALQDVPERQCRRVLGLDLSRHLAVVGGPRSGRTSALLTVAGSAAQHLSPEELQIVALDTGVGGLRVLEVLPHCGAVVDIEDTERVLRLLGALRRELVRRRASGTARASAGRVGGGTPHLLLLLDQWDAFVSAFADLDAGQHVEELTRLLRDGPALGITAVVSSDRSLLLGRTAALLPQRLLLRLPDVADYAAAGLAPRDVPGRLSPGRGVDGDGTLTQVAMIADSEAATRVAVERLAASFSARRSDHQVRVDPLPDHVTPAATEALRRAPVPPGPVVTVGAGGDHLGPLDVDLAADGPVLLVGGPPRSGRSTALLTLAGSLLNRGVPPTEGPVVVIAPRPSPLRRLVNRPGVFVLSETTLDGPGAALVREASVLVVDDAELVLDTALGSALDAAVSAARDTGAVVLAGGTTSGLLSSYRGWLVEARRGRTGLLLAPESAADGELLGCRLSRSTGLTASPPGRAILVVRGVAEHVQVAHTLAVQTPKGQSSAAHAAAAQPLVLEVEVEGCLSSRRTAA